MNERWKSNRKKSWVAERTVEMKKPKKNKKKFFYEKIMGGGTVEITFYILTIEKVEKKMGGSMVEIKFDIFTMKKSWVKEQWK